MQQSQGGEIRFVHWVEQLCQRSRDPCFQRLDARAQCDHEAEEQNEDGKDKRRSRPYHGWTLLPSIIHHAPSTTSNCQAIGLKAQWLLGHPGTLQPKTCTRA